MALSVGTIELVGVLPAQLHWNDAVSSRIADLDLNDVGFLIEGLFIAVWAAAITSWKLGHVEHRWPAGGSSEPDR